jgi:hypothetical protein
MKETPSASVYGLYAREGANRAIAFANPGGGEQNANGTALSLNTWSHLTATYNGTTLQFYINGVLAGTRAVGAPLVTSGSPLRLGGNAVWGEFLAGRVDEVRIYNRVLSVAEIQADMNTPVGNPLRLEGTPIVSSTPAAPPDPDAITVLVENVRQRWAEYLGPVGGPDSFASVTVGVLDLPGDKLGLASGQSVWLDLDAAGHGWFLDPTPADDAEFATGEVGGQVDALTVLMHEFGHVLGYEDMHEDPWTGSTMAATLPVGHRRINLAPLPRFSSDADPITPHGFDSGVSATVADDPVIPPVALDAKFALFDPDSDRVLDDSTSDPSATPAAVMRAEPATTDEESRAVRPEVEPAIAVFRQPPNSPSDSSDRYDPLLLEGVFIG